MYLGTHVDNDTLRIWSWPDNTNTIGQNDVNHTAFNSSTYTCTTNDGFNPCGRSSNRVRGGWVGNGIIGFSWDAAQGSQGLGNFPFPYTFVVRINQSTFALIDQPIVWNVGPRLVLRRGGRQRTRARRDERRHRRWGARTPDHKS